ncbi:MAG: hypothetical protein ACHQUC_08465, partial [Chlamydiales bacterium]
MSLFGTQYLLLALLPLITAANPISASSDCTEGTPFTSLSGGAITINGSYTSHNYPHVSLGSAVDGSITVNCVSITGTGSKIISAEKTTNANLVLAGRTVTNMGFISGGYVTCSPSAWQSIQFGGTSGCYFDHDFFGKNYCIKTICFKNNSETFPQVDQTIADFQMDRSSLIHLNFDEKKLLSSIVSIQGPSLHFSYDEENNITMVVDESGAILFDNSTPSHLEDRNVYVDA